MQIAFESAEDTVVFYLKEGNYEITLDRDFEGVTFTLDFDARGNVLSLEASPASRLFEVVRNNGGELNLPEQVDDPESFNIKTLFSS